MDILIFSQFHPKIYEINKGCVKKSKEAKNRFFYLKSLRERDTGLRVLEQLSRRKTSQKKAEKWPFDFSSVWKKGSISLNPSFFFLMVILHFMVIKLFKHISFIV